MCVWGGGGGRQSPACPLMEARLQLVDTNLSSRGSVPWFVCSAPRSGIPVLDLIGT